MAEKTRDLYARYIGWIVIAQLRDFGLNMSPNPFNLLEIPKGSKLEYFILDQEYLSAIL